MTPPAMTAAGRAEPHAPTGRAAPAPGHRRRLRRRAAPSALRRLSGPLVRHRETAAIPRHGGTLGMRALAVVRSLPEHSLIDRLVRGRAWIPVLGVLLAGIVAMQVEVLKLGTSMGKLLQRSTALQSQNESLQASVASLGDDQRIERLASGMGMVMPAPTTIAFLKAAPGGDASRALANLHAPDPTTFASELAAQVASAAVSAGTATSSSGGTTSASSAGTTASGPAIPSAASTIGTSAPTTAATTATPPTAATTSATTVASAAPAQPATQSSSAAAPGAASAPQSQATGAAAMAPTGSSQSGSPAGG